MLILPTGAGREDIVDPSRIHSYVKENAVSWYRYYNRDSEGKTRSPVSNGTIYVVTGVDRAHSWASAVCPRFHKQEEIKTLAWSSDTMKPKTSSPWEDIDFLARNLSQRRVWYYFPAVDGRGVESIEVGWECCIRQPGQDSSLCGTIVPFKATFLQKN